MNNQIKNKIIELHLQGDLSQGKIGKHLGVAQSSVSKTIKAYNDGRFIYTDSSVEKENKAEYEQIVAPSSDEVNVATEITNIIEREYEQVATPISDELPTTAKVPNVVESEYKQVGSPIANELPATVEIPPALESECEQSPASTFDKQSIIVTSKPEITAEYEQTKPSTNLNKSKITFTNHGLWLNQFALQLLDNPTHLAYSFDSENVNLYIAPYDENNLLPFYTCSTKCSKNYTKTANKPLINEIQEILELEFKGKINIDFNKNAFKVHFNFRFENGQFIINIPSMISKVGFDIL